MNNSHNYEMYLYFIEATEALKKMPLFPILDSIETDLLNEISLRWQKGNSLLVNEAISLEKIGSRATLHARIKNLRQKGYVDFHNDIDGRKKILKPTMLATGYFSALSQLLEQAVEKNVIKNQARNRRSTDRNQFGSGSESHSLSFN
jgi:hypothetical protein